jgi:hypothetical protein
LNARKSTEAKKHGEEMNSSREKEKLGENCGGINVYSIKGYMESSELNDYISVVPFLR